MHSDAAYALLYQNKTMVELLLRAWAPGGIADTLDFASLRSEPTKNYDADGRQRAGDLLFTVRIRGGQRVWIAILLEMQSSCDRMMPWRMLSYATLFWRRVQSDGRLQNGKLPGLLSLVVYNGSKPWNAARDMRGCVNIDAASQLWPYTANMEYLLVDIKRQSPARLEALQNPVGWSMLLEQADDPETLDTLARKLDAWCAQHDLQGVWNALKLLMRELLVAGREDRGCLESESLTEEEKAMSLAENLPPWRIKLEQSAMQKGEQLGLQRGEQLGLQRGEQLGLQRGEQLGLQRGEQLGLSRGLRLGVQAVLEARFGGMGARFWQDHFERRISAPWLEILAAAQSARSLDDLHGFRAQA